MLDSVDFKVSLSMATELGNYRWHGYGFSLSPICLDEIVLICMCRFCWELNVAS
jgi:hypothetical protein